MLPHGKMMDDVLDAMLTGVDPNNLEYLSQVYDSLDTLGAGSPFFEQAFTIIQTFFFGL